MASVKISVALLRGLSDQLHVASHRLGKSSPGLKLLVRSSSAVLYANGFLLLTVTFMPFPTAVLAEYINTPQANVAAVFYSAACLAMNLGFNVCWLCTRRPARLLAPSVCKAAERKVTIRTLSGLAFYLCTTVLAYWLPVTALISISGVQVLWIVASVDEGDRDVTTDLHPLVAVESKRETTDAALSSSTWFPAETAS